jgi:hypothetical protein
VKRHVGGHERRAGTAPCLAGDRPRSAGLRLDGYIKNVNNLAHEGVKNG